MQRVHVRWIQPAAVAQDHYDAVSARTKKFVRDRIRMYNVYYGFFYARISIKRMRSRWGSCSRLKNLNFHYRLFFLPLELADYVIIHELCHLQEMNHSKEFWSLVAKTCPDYRVRRRVLRFYSNLL